MAKKKPSVVEKIVDAVDHVLHPEHAEAAAEVAAEEATPVDSDQDFQKHPKFDKFKTLEGEN